MQKDGWGHAPGLEEDRVAVQRFSHSYAKSFILTVVPVGIDFRHSAEPLGVTEKRPLVEGFSESVQVIGRVQRLLSRFQDAACRRAFLRASMNR
jgi:hypothetical protein